jgi:hypothetical protein
VAGASGELSRKSTRRFEGYPPLLLGTSPAGLSCLIRELGGESAGFWSLAGVGRVRIRWKAAGKVAAIAVGGLLALQVLPGLLKPPAPPPLGADVGLPQVEVRPQAEPPPPPLSSAPKPRKRGRLDAKISSKPKPHRRKKRSQPKRVKSRPTATPPAIAPPPEPAPEPAPPPAPEPSPAPSEPPTRVPPPPANDGSMEFAPR